MQILFKETVANPNAAVGDTNFRQHYTSVNVNMAFAEIKPTIRQATDRYLIPFVGKELYSAIAVLYNNNATLTVNQAECLQRMQDTIAHYAIYDILPQKNYVIAAAGNAAPVAQDVRATPPQWAVSQGRIDALDKADAFLDGLLAFLETAVKTDTYFNLWKNSSAFEVKKSDFFRTTAQLDDFLNIKKSFRTFISLAPYLRQAEKNIVKPLICDALYEALLSANVSVTNAKLLPYIQNIVAYHGAWLALPHHRIVIDGDGFRVVSQTDGFTDRRNMTNNVHQTAIDALRDEYQRRYIEEVSQLQKFLESNLADYPQYRDSSCRILMKSTSHSIRQSPDGIGTVGIF